ncbi:MAG TPA: hypothetical protein PL033_06075 [Candidatus Brocadiia bacterium]|nr:hypothetical protein [Candidatus Brocadiia bacterium]
MLEGESNKVVTGVKCKKSNLDRNISALTIFAGLFVMLCTFARPFLMAWPFVLILIFFLPVIPVLRRHKVALSSFAVSSVLFGTVFSGYGVHIYYSCPVIMVFDLLLALHVTAPKRSFVKCLCAVVILLSTSFAGGYGGFLAKLWQCRRFCDPMVQLVETYARTHNNCYPRRAEDVEGFIATCHASGYRIAVVDSDHSSFSLLEESDAVFVLDPPFSMDCFVMVTHRVPMSFTRYYIYRWNCRRHRWELEKGIWWWRITRL